jgi:predicted transposase YdaD
MRRSRDEGLKEGILKGLSKGLKEGLSKGINKERTMIVQNCYKNGMSIEQIVIFTGVAEKEIKAILSKSRHPLS